MNSKHAFLPINRNTEGQFEYSFHNDLKTNFLFLIMDYRVVIEYFKIL